MKRTKLCFDITVPLVFYNFSIDLTLTVMSNHLVEFFINKKATVII